MANFFKGFISEKSHKTCFGGRMKKFVDTYVNYT